MIIVLKPSTSKAVDLTSMPVSSLFLTVGIGVSKSPSTSSFIRFAQAFMGLLIFPASKRAMIMEMITAPIITMMLRAMPL